ncbi:hypothetical protein AGABI1DRAFT_112321 [Agaricus bisporus var. burnettii JB137-S8]|uniref:Smr domain-containing protein n=1 Tax=Agaricus bisporus var. burnettii (strain JB137-S8 / ATCC MYA-4627 / FGSC 10392) TaxID=597362 RepID=K5W164_AGABU|nr:uncharacterized protein AGABI1DRAFT_112321 [Agaricus bisporus var. burnettii JB137-S8]EKM80539.1 hypothetical protein AGABI1DRAFT_112321 [Agaricus bisporus var. burnettii JB137-S8]
MKLNYRKEKKLAKAGGQLVLARELAEKENEHRNRCDMFNAQASELIFAQNNKHGSLDWVVLHDLKAKEAKVHTKRVIEEARAKGIIKIRLVVGEQSSSGALKPAMLKFLRKKRELLVEVDPLYEGVLVVRLVSTSTESPPAVWDQTLLQPSLSQTSQPAPSPIVISHIDAPPDRLTGDSTRGLAQNCEVTSTPLVPVGGEELSELPQRSSS